VYVLLWRNWILAIKDAIVQRLDCVIELRVTLISEVLQLASGGVP
jgi:hypothetical protein